MSTIEDNRLRRMKLLQERKKERLKKICLRRHKHLKFIKNEEKKRFRALMNGATRYNNCNIIRKYLKEMECQWRKESNDFTKEQKNKLKEARILIDRYDPLVAEYKNLQDLSIDNTMMNKPWSEIQKIIDNWLKIS